MIDFHNHILPGVDDGAKTLEESMEMLRFASQQGITEVVQTVHFQHPKMERKNVDYDYLKSKVLEVQSELKKQNLNIKIHLSAEVFYLPNLSEILNNPLVTIGKKKYMLLEFQSNIYPINYQNEIFSLQSNGTLPIIAHPERYRFVKEDISILNEWINRDYVIQIDAGSIIGHFGKNTKKIAIEMIKNGFVHIIGSDAHNNNKRNFCLLEAYRILEELFSSRLTAKLKKNVYKILNGDDVEKIGGDLSIKNNPFNRMKKFFKF